MVRGLLAENHETMKPKKGEKIDVTDGAKGETSTEEILDVQPWGEGVLLTVFSAWSLVEGKEYSLKLPSGKTVLASARSVENRENDDNKFVVFQTLIRVS